MCFDLHEKGVMPLIYYSCIYSIPRRQRHFRELRPQSVPPAASSAQETCAHLLCAHIHRRDHAELSVHNGVRVHADHTVEHEPGESLRRPVQGGGQLPARHRQIRPLSLALLSQRERDESGRRAQSVEQLLREAPSTHRRARQAQRLERGRLCARQASGRHRQSHQRLLHRTRLVCQESDQAERARLLQHAGVALERRRRRRVLQPAARLPHQQLQPLDKHHERAHIVQQLAVQRRELPRVLGLHGRVAHLAHRHAQLDHHRVHSERHGHTRDARARERLQALAVAVGRVRHRLLALQLCVRHGRVLVQHRHHTLRHEAHRHRSQRSDQRAGAHIHQRVALLRGSTARRLVLHLVHVRLHIVVLLQVGHTRLHHIHDCALRGQLSRHDLVHHTLVLEPGHGQSGQLLRQVRCRLEVHFPNCLSQCDRQERPLQYQDSTQRLLHQFAQSNIEK